MKKLAHNNYYPALTGIRAIAAWMVFIHHFNFFKPQLFGSKVFAFFNECHVGVTLFFVLSGLLITLRYFDKILVSKKWVYKYLVHRFARIYPVYFIILTVNFLGLLYFNNPNITSTVTSNQYVVSIFLVQGFFVNFAGALLPQSWSLTVEECFYLSAPFIFLVVKKQKIFLLIIPIALILTGLLCVFIFTPYNLSGFFGSYRFLFNFTFFGRCTEFFIGIAIALLYKQNNYVVKRAKVFTTCGIALTLVSIFTLSTLSTTSTMGDYHPFGIVINNFLLPATGIACLFWGLLTEKNVVIHFLSTPIMLLLGKSSYIFYLIHIGFFINIFVIHVSANPVAVFLYLNFLAVILYQLIESPINLWIKTFLLKKV